MPSMMAWLLMISCHGMGEGPPVRMASQKSRHFRKKKLFLLSYTFLGILTSTWLPSMSL